MNYLSLIGYMVQHATEITPENNRVHYKGIMPITFKKYPGYEAIEKDGYITDLDKEIGLIYYNFYQN